MNERCECPEKSKLEMHPGVRERVPAGKVPKNLEKRGLCGELESIEISPSQE
jgi:hypothetical protein